MTKVGQNEIGMVIMAGTMLVSPTLDILAKVLISDFHPVQIVFVRFFIHAIFFLSIIALRGRGFARPCLSHMLAGVLVATQWLLLVASFSMMQVSTALTIFFVEPLLLVVLSFFLLREPLSARNIGAVVVGLVGAAIVIRPNLASFGLIGLMPLGSAACFALYLVLNKRTGAARGYLQMQLWVGTFAAVFFGIIIATMPLLGFSAYALKPISTLPHALLFLGIGVLGGAVHLCIAGALRLTPASVLAPFQYLELIGATLLGLWVFGTWPDYPTLCGAAVIVGAGIYSFNSGRQRTELAPVS
nr:DMT family transporter [Mesorhizobium sp. WSM4875]